MMITAIFWVLFLAQWTSRHAVEFKIPKCGVNTSACAGYNMLYGSSERSREFHSSRRHVSPWGDVLLRSVLPRGKWILGSDKETGAATLLTRWKQPGLTEWFVSKNRRELSAKSYRKIPRWLSANLFICTYRSLTALGSVWRSMFDAVACCCCVWREFDSHNLLRFGLLTALMNSRLSCREGKRQTNRSGLGSWGWGEILWPANSHRALMTDELHRLWSILKKTTRHWLCFCKPMWKKWDKWEETINAWINAHVGLDTWINKQNKCLWGQTEDYIKCLQFPPENK